MVKCPYCGRAAMSLRRKSALGPGRAVNCQSCGKRVSVHWIAVFAAIPAFIGGLVLMRSESLPLGFAAAAGGILAMGILHTFLVPLVRSDT
jgi:cytochrome b subunit of formate dehydrogenase